MYSIFMGNAKSHVLFHLKFTYSHMCMVYKHIYIYVIFVVYTTYFVIDPHIWFRRKFVHTKMKTMNERTLFCLQKIITIHKTRRNNRKLLKLYMCIQK